MSADMETSGVSVLDRFTLGVYGEKARINNDFNGGPQCAAQVPLTFILGTIAVMTPVYFISIRAGLNKLMETHEKKKVSLAKRLDPTWIETLMGVLCIMCIVGNLYYKWHTMTLIFMFNPCHVVCVSTQFIHQS